MSQENDAAKVAAEETKKADAEAKKKADAEAKKKAETDKKAKTEADKKAKVEADEKAKADAEAKNVKKVKRVRVICEGTLGPLLLKEGDVTDDEEYVGLLETQGDRKLVVEVK